MKTPPAAQVVDEDERGMPRKLVAFKEGSLGAAQEVADVEYPSAIAGKPGNVSAVIRDALDYYLVRHKGKAL